MFIQNTNFTSTKDFNTPEYAKKRATRMLGATAIGGIASSLFYQKKYSGKKLIMRSLETGALLGLSMDIFNLAVDSTSNAFNRSKIKTTTSKVTNDYGQNIIDLSPYRDKEFFKNLYSGTNSQDKNINKYQKLLEDKTLCDKIFQDKEVLQASQEALMEINTQKIIEAKMNGSTEDINSLEALDTLLRQNLDKGKINNNVSLPNGGQNVNFKSIFNLFHNNNETLKQKAEIVVNRYASSAAATAATLANTGIGDTIALTLITKNMCKKIFKIYDCNGGYIAAITGASVGAVAGTNLLAKGATIWPGAGNALNATITYSLHQLEGRALIEFLEECGDELVGMKDADALAKFFYKIKSGLNIIKNDKVREILEKSIDKAFDIIF